MALSSASFRWCSRGILCLVLSLVALGSKPALAQFEGLLTRVPTDANAILLLNAEKIHNSPIAQREGWKTRHEQAFQSGVIYLPPDTRQFVLASELDIEFMHPLWSVSVMNFPDQVDLAHAASTYGGTQESLANCRCLALAEDAYLVQFDDHVAGAMAPGNRQQVARWVHSVGVRSQPLLSPYLTDAASYADKVGTEVILAIDLDNVLSPTVVRAKLKESEVLEGKTVDLEAMTAVLSSLRGATLGVRITERRYGSLKIDFGVDASPLGEYAKPMLLSALGNSGGMIEEFKTWQAKIDGTKLTLSGELTESGMRRILSLIEPPTESMNDLVKSSASDIRSPSEKPTAAEATLNYFKEVNTLLGDLEKSRSKVGSYSENSLWFNKYARYIDRLPVLNVDREMVDYGAWTAGALRSAGNSIQTMGIQSAKRTAQVQPQIRGTINYGGTSYGRYGAYRPYGSFYGSAQFDVRNVQGERRAIRAEEKAQAATDANSIMQDIEQATADVRRKMTVKYEIEF